MAAFLDIQLIRRTKIKKINKHGSMIYMSKKIQVGWKAISKRVYELTNCRFTRGLCEKIRDMEVDSLTDEEFKAVSVLTDLCILDGDEITTRILLFESQRLGSMTIEKRLNASKQVDTLDVVIED